MTEDELAHWAGDVTEPLDADEMLALWRVARRDLDNPATTTSRAADAWDSLRLIAEVRRLRTVEAAARVLLLEWAETPGPTGYPLAKGLARMRQALSGLDDAAWRAAHAPLLATNSA